MGLQQFVENVLLSHVELATHNATVVDTENGIDILHALRADVSKLLDLGGSVLDLFEPFGKECGSKGKR
jgi:hypothetical protein